MGAAATRYARTRNHAFSSLYPRDDRPGHPNSRADLRETFDADVLEVKSASGLVTLQGNGSDGGVEVAPGARWRPLHAVGLEVVDDGFVVELHGDVLSLDGDADAKPLRLINGRLGQVHDGVEAAGLAFFLPGGVELHLVAVGEMVFR